MSTPLIRAVKGSGNQEMLTIIDCPPGTSCPMIAAVRDADFVLLVTEPTPFGLHDLTLAVETVSELGIPFGVIVNRSDAGDSRVFDYCTQENIPVLLKIPENRGVAEAYSRGESILSAMPDLKGALLDVLHWIELQSGRKQA
jgi:MinD superfamily P-loop ATPase